MNITSFTGAEAMAVPHKKNMNQTEFWSAVGVTQSAASRYEAGHNIPRPVQILLHLAYGKGKGKAASIKLLGLEVV